MKKGKQETYLKDDEALEAFLTALALNNTQLFTSKDAPPITGERLETLVNEYREVKKTINRVARRLPREMLDSMIYHKTLTAEDLEKESEVKNWMEDLEEKLNKDRKSGSHRYEFKIRKDNELNIYLPHLTMYHHGVESEYLLSKEFFVSEDYKKISTLGEQLESLIEPGAFMKRGEKIANSENRNKESTAEAARALATRDAL